MERKLTIGFLPANRGFFDRRLAMAARGAILEEAARLGVHLVVPGEAEFSSGCVGSAAEAVACSKLFAGAGVQGVLVSAVNFGDEQAVALCLRDLGVPVLLHACPEDGPLSIGSKRRDAFCGLLSIADALRQCGIKYSLPRRPVSRPGSDAFSRDLLDFAAVCRVVSGIRRARYGQAGARPDAFWTCRFDERALQRLGPTVVTSDLSEILSACSTIEGAGKLADDFGPMAAGLPGPARLKLAALELVLRQWIEESRLDAVAIQCWTSIQQNFGICPCFAMSRLADLGVPAACEADIPGAMAMHALSLASGGPGALADWNNLHHADPDLVNLWHCGVYPASMAANLPHAGKHSILPDAGACREEDAFGVLNMRVRSGPATLCRIAEDASGQWRALIVEGDFEDDPSETAGSFGWCRIPRLQALYRDTLLRHFPHHVAFTLAPVGDVLQEALGTYFAMTVHRHG